MIINHTKRLTTVLFVAGANLLATRFSISLHLSRQWQYMVERYPLTYQDVGNNTSVERYWPEDHPMSLDRPIYDITDSLKVDSPNKSDYEDLNLKDTSTYLSSKFRSKDSTCSNILSECYMVYDAECFHVCEVANYHRIESCLSKIYPLFQMALMTNSSTSPVCILYVEDGFFNKDMRDTFFKAWDVVYPQSNILFKPYRNIDQRKRGDGCWIHTRSRSPTDITCFNVAPNAAIYSSIDQCQRKCEKKGEEVFVDIRRDLSRVWGDFSHSIPGSVLLIDRPLDKSREDSRAFEDPLALRKALETHFSRVMVYDGSKSSFSLETALMFGAAEVVVGYHGAGVSNLLFSSRGTAVVELFAEGCNETVPLTINSRMQEFGYKPWRQILVGQAVGVTKGRGPCKWIQSVRYNEDNLETIVQTVKQVQKERLS